MSKVPYVCSKCGVSGVKLWRQYNTCVSAQELLCVECLAKETKIDISKIDSDGRYEDPSIGCKTHSVGWHVPAIPTDDEESFWGYTSVPVSDCYWWKKLPLTKKDNELQFERMWAVTQYSKLDNSFSVIGVFDTREIAENIIKEFEKENEGLERYFDFSIEQTYMYKGAV